MDWTQAKCRDVDTELFFPVGTTGPALAQIAQAKAVCAGCPLIDPCRVLGASQGYGIYGGLTETERRETSQIGEHRPDRPLAAAAS